MQRGGGLSQLSRLLTRVRPVQQCRFNVTSTTLGGISSLAMHAYGPEDAPKTVVFLHGIMGNKRNWRNPALMLCKLNPNVKCITIDLRGHGDSQNLPGVNTVLSCAEDLYDTFQTFNIQPTVLSAHSFGGKVALQYLELSRDVVKAPEVTWILDSMPGLYSTSEDNNSVMKVLGVVKEIPKTFPSREWLLKFLTLEKKLPTPLAQWLATNVIIGKPDCHFGLNIDVIVELMDDFCKFDAWPILENYSCDEKIIYLRAENNRNWSEKTIERLKKLESESGSIKYLEMPNVGHWLHSENPAGLLEIIMAKSNL